MTRPSQFDTATSDAHDPSSVTARRKLTRSARSPSLARSATSTGSKRSPSPIVTFQPTVFPVDNPKGVQDITRRVIRQLEGLGNLELLDIAATPEESDEVDQEERMEVENVLSSEPTKPAATPRHTNGHAHVNGNGVAKVEEKPVDYEIPRKILHGSIGFFTLYLYIAQCDVRKIIIALSSALAIIYPADVLRFRSKRFARLYERLLGFLMRDSERESVNGVVWYILGVNFALSVYPSDVATVAILILSWADTTASTFGRLYGRRTRKLPARVPILNLPFAPRKSLAGFIAASLTGAGIAAVFWGFVAPMRLGGAEATWTWERGLQNLGGGGALGLALITIVAGLVSGIAEALDLGSIDDNLSLPIISGGCLLGFFKLFELGLSSISSWLS